MRLVAFGMFSVKALTFSPHAPHDILQCVAAQDSIRPICCSLYVLSVKPVMTAMTSVFLWKSRKQHNKYV